MKAKNIIKIMVIFYILLCASWSMAQTLPIAIDPGNFLISPIGKIDLALELPVSVGPDFEYKIMVKNVDLLKKIQVPNIAGTIDLQKAKSTMNLTQSFNNLADQNIEAQVELPGLDAQTLKLNSGGKGDLRWIVPLKIQDVDKKVQSVEVSPLLSMNDALFTKSIDKFSFNVILPTEAKKLVKSNQALTQQTNTDGRLTYQWGGENLYLTSLHLWWTTSAIDLNMTKDVQVNRKDLIVTVVLKVKNQGKTSASNIVLKENFPSQDYESISQGSQGTFTLYKGELNDQRLIWTYNLPTLAAGNEVEVKYLLKMLYDLPTVNLRETCALENGEPIAVSTLTKNAQVYSIIRRGDTTAPDITCPADITRTATGRLTAVDFTATAKDNEDGNPEITYEPESGSEFPIGTTTVTATATDDAGNKKQCTFKVTVKEPGPSTRKDTTAPVIRCPKDINVTATGVQTKVTFEATAIDDQDTSPSISYDIAPYSEFPIGLTPVTVTATDDLGNESKCTFMVTVKQPTDNRFSTIIRAIGQDAGEGISRESEVIIGLAATSETTIAPPIPPTCTAYLSLQDPVISTDYDYKDIRQLGVEPKTWILRVQTGSSADSDLPGYYPELSWDTRGFCPQGYFKLWSANSKGVLGAILVEDMRSTDNYTLKPGDQYFGVTWVNSDEMTITLDLPVGWSMISLPVRPSSRLVKSLFPDAEAIYDYDSKYVPMDAGKELEVGKGYWIYLPKAKSYQIKGAVIDSFTLEGKKGWSMIGSCSSPAKASVNKGKIEAIYDYENKYKPIEAAESLKPGKGYWVSLTESATIKVEKKALSRGRYEAAPENVNSEAIVNFRDAQTRMSVTADWSLKITASGQDIGEGICRESDIILGQAATAETVIAPPRLFVYTVYSALRDAAVSTKYNYKDIRGMEDAPQKWLLKVEIGGDADPDADPAIVGNYYPRLSWDQASLGAGKMELRRGKTDTGAILIADMSTTASYQTEQADVRPDGIWYMIIFTPAPAPASPALSVTPQNLSINPTTGQVTFTVSNTGSGTMNWTASIIEGAEWLSILSSTAGMNTGIVTVSFKDNSAFSQRTGKIRITASGGAQDSPKDVAFVQGGKSASPEVCDGKDNDGDGQVDEGVKTTYYADTDGDGYGNSSASIQACSAPTQGGYVTDNTDCDDKDNTIHPHASEISCNGKDDDCQGGDQCNADCNQNYPDPIVSFDGSEATTTSGVEYVQYKLSVVNRSVYPPELFVASPKLPPCGLNPNASRTWADIYDGEGKRIYGYCGIFQSDQLKNLLFSIPKDSQPPECVVVKLIDRLCEKTYTSACISLSPLIEVCDGKDNDGDGQVDEGVKTTYYADSDGDGYGNSSASIQACSAPTQGGYVTDNTDCDDTDKNIHMNCVPQPNPLGGALTIEGAKGQIGDEVQITVKIQAAPKQINSFGLHVTYDATVLEYTGYDRGDLVTSFLMFNAISHPSGNEIRIGGVGDEAGISQGASGSLVLLKFKVKGGLENHCYSLGLSNVVDGLVGFSQSGGEFCISAMCNGDLNKDGTITPADALVAFRCYLQTGPCPACADVNRDLAVTPADAHCLFKRFLEQASCLDK